MVAALETVNPCCFKNQTVASFFFFSFHFVGLDYYWIQLVSRSFEECLVLKALERPTERRLALRIHACLCYP